MVTFAACGFGPSVGKLRRVTSAGLGGSATAERETRCELSA
jgi:hypothetical protein